MPMSGPRSANIRRHLDHNNPEGTAGRRQQPSKCRRAAKTPQLRPLSSTPKMASRGGARISRSIALHQESASPRPLEHPRDPENVADDHREDEQARGRSAPTSATCFHQAKPSSVLVSGAPHECLELAVVASDRIADRSRACASFRPWMDPFQVLEIITDRRRECSDQRADQPGLLDLEGDARTPAGRCCGDQRHDHEQNRDDEDGAPWLRCSFLHPARPSIGAGLSRLPHHYIPGRVSPDAHGQGRCRRAYPSRPSGCHRSTFKRRGRALKARPNSPPQP